MPLDPAAAAGPAHRTGDLTAVVAVTPNPAWDVTYDLPGPLAPGEVHRVARVHSRAGGKGVNVASVLHALGVPAVATGPVGGPAARAFTADLDRRGVRGAFVAVTAATRSSVAVVDAAGAVTVLNEPGPRLGPADLDALVARVAELAAGGQPVAVSGSWPPGWDAEEALGRLRDVVPGFLAVDAGGPVLLAAAGAGADLVKPNTRELADATGTGDPGEGMRRLRERGVRYAVVSDGERGLWGSGPGGTWRAWLPAPVAGNATGAGDAALAGLLEAWLRAPGDMPGALARAAATGAAAVLAPVAGQVDPRDVARFARAVEVRGITPGAPS